MKSAPSTGSPPTFWELALQVLSSTRRGYDLLAPKFESTPYATPFELLEHAFLRLDEFRGSEAGGYAADLACGTGRAARQLLRRGYRVDGFDFSSEMLAQAARTFEATHAESSFQPHQVDLRDLLLERERYSVVVTFGAWGHILPEWREELLVQALSSLRQRGIFLTVSADPPRPGGFRWWRTKLFDLAIVLRNLLWPGEFHMYYGLNQTPELTGALSRAIVTLAPKRFRIVTENVPLEKYRELRLLVVVRDG